MVADGLVISKSETIEGIMLFEVLEDCSGEEAASLLARRRLLSLLGTAVKIPTAMQSADRFLVEEESVGHMMKS
jgi:hypothetical protein